MVRRIDLRKELAVEPGTRARLGRRDPGATFGWDKDGGQR